MPDTIRVGVVGAGGNTRLHHIPKLKKIDGVEIVSVSNRSRASSERVAQEFGIPRVHDHWQDLVNDAGIDAVVIGTWPYMAIVPRFSASTFWDAAVEYDATEVNIIDAIGTILQNRPRSEFRREHRLRAMYGVRHNVESTFRDEFRVRHLIGGYGMNNAAAGLRCSHSIRSVRGTHSTSQDSYARTSSTRGAPWSSPVSPKKSFGPRMATMTSRPWPLASRTCTRPDRMK